MKPKEITEIKFNKTKIALLNIRGLNPGKMEDICREIKENNIDIMGLTETRQHHTRRG